MPITEAERKYLKNKHKGGKNNSKGNRYENYYAVFQIASLMNSCCDSLKNVYLRSQLSDTFIDDLLIVKKNSQKTYHQLKDVQTLNWNSLVKDFKRQAEISTEQQENFEIKLVHSIKDYSNNIPNDLVGYTTVEYFPSHNELNQLYWYYTPFKTAIVQIAVEGSSDDALTGIAASILGAWTSINTDEPISLKQNSEKVYNINGFDGLKVYPTIEMSKKCMNILNNIGVTFNINGTTLYWSYGHFEGKIKLTKEIEQNLLEIVPSNFVVLIGILS